MSQALPEIAQMPPTLRPVRPYSRSCASPATGCLDPSLSIQRASDFRPLALQSGLSYEGLACDRVEYGCPSMCNAETLRIWDSRAARCAGPVPSPEAGRVATARSHLSTHMPAAIRLRDEAEHRLVTTPSEILFPQDRCPLSAKWGISPMLHAAGADDRDCADVASLLRS